MLTRMKAQEELTRRSVDRPVEEGAGPASPPARRRWFMEAAAFAAAVLAAGVVVALGVAVFSGGPQDRVETANTGPAVGSQEFLLRLAEQGYIPREAVDDRRLLLERLVANGTVPAGSRLPDREIPEHLRYTRYEEQLIKAVEAGHVPEEALRDDELYLKRLVNDPPGRRTP